MQLHKQLTEAINVQNSITKTYESVDFGSHFFSFLDSLECRNLRNTSYSRKVTEEGIVWDDSVAHSGGICMITEKHPGAHRGNAGRLTVRGSQTKVTEFEEHLKRYATLNIA